jgi:hypothetical protein
MDMPRTYIPQSYTEIMEVLLVDGIMKCLVKKGIGMMISKYYEVHSHELDLNLRLAMQHRENQL